MPSFRALTRGGPDSRRIRRFKDSVKTLFQGQILLQNILPEGCMLRGRDQRIRARTFVVRCQGIYLSPWSGPTSTRAVKLISLWGCAWTGHLRLADEGSIPASTPLATCFVRSTHVVLTVISLGRTACRKPKCVWYTPQRSLWESQPASIPDVIGMGTQSKSHLPVIYGVVKTAGCELTLLTASCPYLLPEWMSWRYDHRV